MYADQANISWSKIKTKMLDHLFTVNSYFCQSAVTFYQTNLTYKRLLEDLCKKCHVDIKL